MRINDLTRRAILAVGLVIGSDQLVLSQEFLRTTIRDFRVDHPDMEGTINFNVFEPEIGIVQPILGPDRKPMFNEAEAPFKTVSTGENFDQWFRHVEGVNTNIIRLLINESAESRFRFIDESFFPINGTLFGNQGLPNNYHFTMEARGSFIYEEGATAQFIGDDDFWLFIDDRLVIDLGGLHDRLGATADIASLDLVPGHEYPIHFFFAERHTTESRFLFETSFEIDQPIEDIDGDGVLTTFDLDELCRFGVGLGVRFIAFDINLDNEVDMLDVEVFLESAGSLPGDVDLDGTVGFSDFLQLSANFGEADADWSQGDVNCNTSVEFDDFLIISGQFGAIASVPDTIAVPEPRGTPWILLASFILTLRGSFEKGL